MAIALGVPVFVVVTKADLAPENVLKETIAQLMRLLKLPGARKKPFVVRTMDDVVVASRAFRSGFVAPIFSVSNVSGANMGLVHAFMNLLPSRKLWSAQGDDAVEFLIDQVRFACGGVTESSPPPTPVTPATPASPASPASHSALCARMWMAAITLTSAAARAVRALLSAASALAVASRARAPSRFSAAARAALNGDVSLARATASKSGGSESLSSITSASLFS